MMKAALLALALASSSCGLIAFDVSEPVPEQTVPGSALGGLLPGFLNSPFAVNINEQQEEAAHNTGPASSASLKSITFEATPHDMPSGNFDFVDEIHIFIAPTASGSSLPMVEIANSAPVPKGQTTLKLNVVPHVNLLPYIKAGSTISATASGSAPSSDFTYDGTVVITIHI